MGGVHRLMERQVIPVSDVAYWSQYYRVFGSAADVYSLISVQDGKSVSYSRYTEVMSLKLGRSSSSIICSTYKLGESDHQPLLPPLFALTLPSIPHAVQLVQPSGLDEGGAQLPPRAGQGHCRGV